MKSAYDQFWDVGEGSLRVAQILPAGEYGGAEAQILALCKGLAQDNVTVEVVTYYAGEFAEKASASGVTVTTLQGGHPLADYRALLRHLQEYRPHIIHTHGVRASMAGRFVGRRLGIPVVTTVHSDLYYDYDPPIKRNLFMAIEALTQSLSVRVIAVSRSLEQKLLRRGYARTQVILVEHGLDTERAQAELAAASERPAMLRGTLGIKADSFIIICVARLHAVKRHDVLIDAIAQVKEVCGREVHLVLVGDGELRDNLVRHSEKAMGRVHFLGVRTDVFALLREADVFALTSQMEGFPISMLEAMMARLPVIGSRVGGMVDIVKEDGDCATGVLVPVGDAEKIADALRRLLADDALRRQMGECGERRVKACFALTEMVQATERLYTNVMNL